MCAVFVDDMYRYPTGQFHRMKMSHMIADTEEELHVMADKIGIARKWYQGDHYDISMTKRQLAIRYGAVPITWRKLGQMTRDRRRKAARPDFTQGLEDRLKPAEAAAEAPRLRLPPDSQGG